MSGAPVRFFGRLRSSISFSRCAAYPAGVRPRRSRPVLRCSLRARASALAWARGDVWCTQARDSSTAPSGPANRTVTAFVPSIRRTAAHGIRTSRSGLRIISAASSATIAGRSPTV